MVKCLFLSPNIMMDGRAKPQIKERQCNLQYFKSYSSHPLNSQNDRTFILSGNYVHNENFQRKIERNVTRHRLVFPVPVLWH